MNILFFFNGDFQEGNAANARFLCYGKGLNSKGVKNCFYVIRPSEFGDTGINTKAKGVVEDVNFEYLSGFTQRGSGVIIRLLRLVKAWIRAIQILNKADDSSIIYLYGPQILSHFPIIYVAKKNNLWIVFEQTELHSLVDIQSRWKKKINNYSHKLIENNTAFFADHIFLTTKKLKDFYWNKYPHLSASILPIVFDPKRFTCFKKRRSSQIAYLGSFGKKDGVPILLEAFAKAKMINPELRLLLIGYQSAGFDLVKELEIANLEDCENVTATGQVTAAEIPRLLGESDLLVIPRINSEYANFGFPIKLGEYMATGNPVLSSDVSDISFYFKNDKDIMLVPPGEVQELADNIVRRYLFYEKYSEVGRRGKKKAEELFDYNQHVETIINVAEMLIHKKTQNS